MSPETRFSILELVCLTTYVCGLAVTAIGAYLLVA